MKMSVVFMLSFWILGASAFAQSAETSLEAPSEKPSGAPLEAPAESLVKTSTEIPVETSLEIPVREAEALAPALTSDSAEPPSQKKTPKDFSGEVHFVGEVFQLPTGKRGMNSFQVPGILLNKDIALEEGHSLKFQLRVSDSELRGETVALNSPGSKVYLDLVPSPEGHSHWLLGLVPNPVNEASRRRWNLDRLGPAAYTFADKYGYFADSDSGLVYQWGHWGQESVWVFRVVNGASSREKEDGFHKDGQIFVSSPLGNQGLWALSYTRGQYDKYAPTLGARERVWLHLGYVPQRGLGISLEAFRSQDPGELVNSLLADGVDLTAASGKSVYGQGASAVLKYITEFGSEIFLRGDQLEPVTNIKGLKRTLSSALVGYSRPLSSQVFLNIAYEHVAYSKNYQNGYRDQGRALLGAAVVF